MFDLFGYLRNATKNAILGGVQDAVESLQSSAPSGVLVVKGLDLTVPALPYESEEDGQTVAPRRRK